MTHITCRLTAKSRDQLRNPTLGSRVYWLPLPFVSGVCSGGLCGHRSAGQHDGGAICSQHYCSRLLCDVAVGCADTAAPVNTTAVRDGDRLTVRCNHTDQVWYMVCINATWHGDAVLCNNGEVSSSQ